VDVAKNRKTFFRIIFGQDSGFVCIAVMSATNRKNFKERFFHYPDELDLMSTFIEESTQGFNVYFCPQLLSDKKREKGYVEHTPNVWSDLDTCEPDNLLIRPTIVVESSPGRYQGYWVMEPALDPDDTEDLARRVAYNHYEQGADRSGWDLTQLLRVPYTYNYKYNSSSDIPMVKIIEATTTTYTRDDFKVYPETPEYTHVDVAMPAEADLPGNGSGDDVLQTRRIGLNPLIWELYNKEPATGTWSQVLWNMNMLMFEQGFSREEVYVVARDAKCNKYARDGRPAHLLWKDICRAEARSAVHLKLLTDNEPDPVILLTDEERDRVAKAEPTFIDRYIEWASELGDAAPQYHQAGAFVCLAGLLCGSVELPTSFGKVIPNLWFMILADTTLTRKTTAMDISVDLLMEVDDDSVMATDGSLEGLLTGLSMRPGQPSIFLRDEFSGLLESMTKKDYMAGMAEMLTKLYDGKMQRRILRKEEIKVENPRLVLFAGGIKSRITSLMTLEQVSSGFLPRFIFITAESDIKRLRPIGPPTIQSTGNRDALIAELSDMQMHYCMRTQRIHIDALKKEVERKVIFQAELTEEAWLRYNQLETALLKAGLDHKIPEAMTPIGDRLSKSILKAALLIAASRQRDEKVVVTELDLLRAIAMGEQWRRYVEDVIRSLGQTNVERQINTILGAIERSLTGISRSRLMQSYHLDSRTAEAIFQTLDQRGLITRRKEGRTELLIPTKVR